MEPETGQRSVGSLFLSLRAEEVSATVEAIALLRNQSWAQPLLAKLEREGGVSKATMPTMFEVRYARALRDCGIVPVYEHSAGVGGTSIDFAVQTNAGQWLVELYSLAETEAAIAATWTQGDFFGRVLHSLSAIDPDAAPAPEEVQRRREEQKRSVEGETLQTIERILSKVSDGKAPLKFPAPVAQTYTVLAVDARTLFHGRPDRGDLDQIAFGAGAVPPEYRCYWPAPDGSLTPLRGFFDPANRSTKAKLFQERVHFVAFILERTYEHDELCRIGYYVANPALFQSQEEVEGILRTFPLYKRATA